MSKLIFPRPKMREPDFTVGDSKEKLSFGRSGMERNVNASCLAC